MRGRYFDEFKVGDTFETGGVTLTESSIIDFALQYDPQFFHIDKAASMASPFGDIIASGFQVLALSFRLVLDSGVLEHNLGGNAADEVRWTKPVKPNDTIRVVGEIIEARPSSSKPHLGVAKIRYTAKNQNGDPVLSFILTQGIKRR
ncbi:MAG: MaoC family dehydratase [Flavobacteriaceae bacterium]